MKYELIAAVVRHILTALGAYLVNAGYCEQSQAESIAGGALALLGLGWSFAHKVKPPGSPPAVLAPAFGMLAAAGLLSGCSSFSAEAIAADGSRLKTHAYTCLDSKSKLAELAASQGNRTNKQSIGVNGLEQESQSPASLVEAAARGLAEGMKK